MLSVLVLAAATVTTTVIPPNRPARANLSCSASYGCEVVVEGERSKDVAITTGAIVARQVNNGDDGGPIRVQLLPTAAFRSTPEGAMQVVTGKLTIVTESNREFVVIVDASEVPAMHRVWFSSAASLVQPIASVVPQTPERASGETAPLDPAKMDFGWSSNGDIACVSAFSVGLQLWCVLPLSLTSVPSVYFEDGRLKEPATLARVVAGRFLVIENGATRTILLELGGGHPRSGHIFRIRE